MRTAEEIKLHSWNCLFMCIKPLLSPESWVHKIHGFTRCMCNLKCHCERFNTLSIVWKTNTPSSSMCSVQRTILKQNTGMSPQPQQQIVTRILTSIKYHCSQNINSHTVAYHSDMSCYFISLWHWLRQVFYYGMMKEKNSLHIQDG